MSRFEDFYEDTFLNEKVSKKEIDTALKNNNILVGAEFEFIMDDFAGFATDEYEAAKRDWERYNDEMERARKHLEDKRDDMWKIQQEIDKIEYDVELVDEDIDDEEKKIKEYQDELKKYKAKPDEYFEKYAVTKEERLKNIQKQIDLYTNSVKKLQSKKKVIEDNINDLQNEYTAMEESLYDDIGVPSLGEDYTMFMDTYSYEDFSYDDWDSFSTLIGEQDMPPEPPFFESGSTVDAIETHMERTGMLEDAPFREYEISGYGKVVQKVGSNKWAIEDDASLPKGGVEVKSPPMPLPEFMKVLPKMFNWIKKYGHTSTKTGMHVHMSIKGMDDLEGKINYMKMMLFLDEGYIWKSFSERMNNSFVKSVKKKLAENAYLSDKELSKVFNLKTIVMKLNTEHQDAINFEYAESGHVEYRYLGGTDYEKKEKNVTASIGHFAHNLSLGFDPEFKKKEYTLKLKRIFNKMELFKLERWKMLIDVLMEGKEAYVEYGMDKRDKMNLERFLKKLNRDIKTLKTIYGKDKRIHGYINRSMKFIGMVEDEFDIEIKKYLSKSAINRLKQL